MRHDLTTHPPGGGRTGDETGATTAEEVLQAALGRLDRVLEARAMRLGAARRAIVEAVLERQGHFEIEDLVETLRSRGIRGSRASVYRTLPLLIEAGILQEAVVTGDARSYESAVGREHHDHILCLGCGKVVEFHFEAFDMLEREVAQRYGFRLESHLHQLVGRCSECQAGARTGPARQAQDENPSRQAGSDDGRRE